ncbi:hypothetical protein KL919_004177 [Ogataea angusta]|nr:hypothetical protein KL919_004177 [Ogataea angusta]
MMAAKFQIGSEGCGGFKALSFMHRLLKGLLFAVDSCRPEGSIQPHAACRRLSRAVGNSGVTPRHNTSQVCHNAAWRRSSVPPWGQPTVHNRPRKSRSARENGQAPPRRMGTGQSSHSGTKAPEWQARDGVGT